MRLSLRKRQMVWGYIFYFPWILGTLVLFAWPLGRSLLLSFQKITNLAGLQTVWVGLANYHRIFRLDVEFIPRLLATVRDLAYDLPLILVLSLVLALLLARVRRGQTLLRAVFFLPVVIGSAGVIQELARAGANAELVGTAMRGIDILMTTQASALPYAGLFAPVQGIVGRLVTIVWHTGVQILLFVAGLNSIPPSLYEASRVDGATTWESFWKITLPMLSPVIMVAAIFTIVDSFTNPLNETVSYIWAIGLGGGGLWSFGSGMELDYASALSWLYFLVSSLLIVLLVAIASRTVFYAGERQ